jgi:hypothetical protein
MVNQLIVKRILSDKECEKRYKSKFLAVGDFDILLPPQDCDVRSTDGELLLKFRKNVIDPQLAKTGYYSMEGAIALTEARGQAAGESFKRTRADGSLTNTTVNNKVETGAAGYMDRNAMVRYCRKTAFTSKYFEQFQTGYPFIKRVDDLYRELCPEYYAKQKNIAMGTNRNYVIGDTTFTTVTVNRNFQTAVHKDTGDFPRGFGNLTVYREGNWTGSYFVLPEYRVAVDMQNGDMLFVDVHKWHGNTPFENFNPAPTPYSNSKMHPDRDKYIWNGGDMRISFVMYYREYMISCKQPTEELKDTQREQGGFLKL